MDLVSAHLRLSPSELEDLHHAVCLLVDERAQDLAREPTAEAQQRLERALEIGKRIDALVDEPRSLGGG